MVQKKMNNELLVSAKNAINSTAVRITDESENLELSFNGQSSKCFFKGNVSSDEDGLVLHIGEIYGFCWNITKRVNSIDELINILDLIVDYIFKDDALHTAGWQLESVL